MTNKLILVEHAFFVDPQKRAIAALIMAVVAAAFSPILVKLAELEISPSAVIFHRLWISSVILGLVKGLRSFLGKLSSIENQPNPVASPNHQLLVLVIATGTCFAATQITWAWSLTQTSVANSALLHSFSPIFVTIVGFLFLGQRFNTQFIVGMIVAISGSILLALNDILHSMSKMQGDGIALISALFLALYLLLAERNKNQDAITKVFYWCLIGSLTALPIFLEPIFSGNLDRIFPTSWLGWITIVELSMVLILTFGMLTYALIFLSSAIAAVALLLDPILTAMLSWAIFSETLDIYNLLAFPIILIGFYLAMNSQNFILDETFMNKQESNQPTA